MELVFNTHVAETPELKILTAEFCYLTELLSDISSTSKGSYLSDPTKSTILLEINELSNRLTKRVDNHREILEDEPILVLIDSVLLSVNNYNQ